MCDVLEPHTTNSSSRDISSGPDTGRSNRNQTDHRAIDTLTSHGKINPATPPYLRG
jgi:hypothetical protein